jgi:hypothetical protein
MLNQANQQQVYHNKDQQGEYDAAMCSNVVPQTSD